MTVGVRKESQHLSAEKKPILIYSYPLFINQFHLNKLSFNK